MVSAISMKLLFGALMLKISKLVPEETVKCHIANKDINSLNGRYNGHTLGLAFALIGDAMTNPEKVQSRLLRDQSHAKALYDMTRQVILTSRLQFLEVKLNCSRVFVSYKPFYSPAEFKELKSKVNN